MTSPLVVRTIILDGADKIPAQHMPDTFPALQTAVSGKIDATSLGVPGGPAKLDADGDVVDSAGRKVISGGGGSTIAPGVLYEVAQNGDGTWPPRPVSNSRFIWMGRPGFGATPPGTGTTTSGTGMADGDLIFLAP